MTRRIAIASLIWGGSILASRLIGLVREAVIGRVLGGGTRADVFWASFVLPDFLNYLLAGGALSIVFIPIFGGYLARGENERAWRAFSAIFYFVLVLMALVVPVLWWLTPRVVPFVAPGFTDQQTAELVTLTRIVLPAQVFHLLGGLLSAVLQARDRHLLPALAPLVYTGSIIAGGLLGGEAWGPYGFAWGVLVGSALGPFGLTLAGCLAGGLRWRPVAPWGADLGTYLLRSVPVMLGWSIIVVDDWILKRQGSLVGLGAVSTLQYAKTLMKVPMGVFGLAAGVAAFPTISRLAGQGEVAEAYRTLVGAARRMLVPAFAAQAALTAAGADVSRLVYGRKIPLEQHEQIGAALALMCLGLWAWSSQSLLARGFYARGNTWTPTVLGTMAVAVFYPLYSALRSWGGTSGLALASSVAVSAYVLVLALWLKSSIPGRPAAWEGFFVRALPALAVALAAGWAGRLWLPLEHPFARLVVLGGGAGAVFLLCARVAGVEEVAEVAASVRGRFRRRLDGAGNGAKTPPEGEGR